MFHALGALLEAGSESRTLPAIAAAHAILEERSSAAQNRDNGNDKADNDGGSLVPVEEGTASTASNMTKQSVPRITLLRHPSVTAAEGALATPRGPPQQPQTNYGETPQSQQLVAAASPSANGSAALVPQAPASPPRGVLLDLPSDPVERAAALAARANKAIQGGLRNCQWEDVKDLYFRAAALFQEAGMHDEAAVAFNNSAAIGRVMGDHLEVAHAATHAIDSFKIVDPPEAVARLQEVMEIHARDGRKLLAAKAAREIAEIFENQLHEDEGALHYYTQANQYFGETANTRPQFLKTFEKVARLSAKTKRYLAAQERFEAFAQQQTKGTRVTVYYMFAMLSILAEAGGERQPTVLAKAKTEFGRYQDIDPFFQSGVEYVFIRGILAAWDKASLLTLDETVKRYSEYRDQDPVVDLLVTQIRENLYRYLEPYL